VGGSAAPDDCSRSSTAVTSSPRAPSAAGGSAVRSGNSVTEPRQHAQHAKHATPALRNPLSGPSRSPASVSSSSEWSGDQPQWLTTSQVLTTPSPTTGGRSALSYNSALPPGAASSAAGGAHVHDTRLEFRTAASAARSPVHQPSPSAADATAAAWACAAHAHHSPVAVNAPYVPPRCEPPNSPPHSSPLLAAAAAAAAATATAAVDDGGVADWLSSSAAVYHEHASPSQQTAPGSVCRYYGSSRTSRLQMLPAVARCLPSADEATGTTMRVLGAAACLPLRRVARRRLRRRRRHLRSLRLRRSRLLYHRPRRLHQRCWRLAAPRVLGCNMHKHGAFR
jgi:hypothetical protein